MPSSAARLPPATAGDARAGGLRSALPLVIAGFVISFVLVGGGIDTVSVFLNAIAATMHWSRSALSLAVSIGAVSAALSTPLVGVAVDRYGVRVPMLIGAGLLAVGFGVLVVMTAAWQFAAANVFLGAGFAACALLPITVAVTVCVPQRTALALGIVAAGSSAGALVLAPAFQAVIEAIGWRGGYVVMGCAVVLTPLLLAASALPRGRLTHHSAASAAAAPRHGVLHDLRRPGVGPLTAIMILPGVASFSLSVHLVPYLTGLGLAGTTAAAALGATIGISAIGKIAGGFVADRVGPLPTVRLALLLWVVALALLQRADVWLALEGFVVLYGLALGAQIALIPAIAIGVLGSERFATLFGVLQLAAMLASAVGPVASGLIFDTTGRYTGAILLWLAAMAAATVIAWSMHAAEVPRVQEAPA
jgi:MFS family permease